MSTSSLLQAHNRQQQAQAHANAAAAAFAFQQQQHNQSSYYGVPSSYPYMPSAMNPDPAVAQMAYYHAMLMGVPSTSPLLDATHTAPPSSVLNNEQQQQQAALSLFGGSNLYSPAASGLGLVNQQDILNRIAQAKVAAAVAAAEAVERAYLQAITGLVPSQAQQAHAQVQAQAQLDLLQAQVQQQQATVASLNVADNSLAKDANRPFKKRKHSMSQSSEVGMHSGLLNNRTSSDVAAVEALTKLSQGDVTGPLSSHSGDNSEATTTASSTPSLSLDAHSSSSTISIAGMTLPTGLSATMPNNNSASATQVSKASVPASAPVTNSVPSTNTPSAPTQSQLSVASAAENILLQNYGLSQLLAAQQQNVFGQNPYLASLLAPSVASLNPSANLNLTGLQLPNGLSFSSGLDNLLGRHAALLSNTVNATSITNTPQQPQDESTSLNSDENQLKGSNPALVRGKYRCSKCGQIKDGHVCSVKDDIVAMYTMGIQTIGPDRQEFDRVITVSKHRKFH